MRRPDSDGPSLNANSITVDPSRNQSGRKASEKFTPSAGKITAFNPPGGTGVRIDTAAYAEGVIPPYYDSLIAKLIVRGKDRSEAVSRMGRALEMFIVEGIYTTIPLHRRILADPEFRAGNFDTGFIERFLAKKETAG